MDVSVSARNVELTAALRSAAEEKIGRLGRFLDGMQRAEVHFSEEKNPRIAAKDVCEVTMEGHGHHVRVKAVAADPLAAVDAAVDKLEHKLHKLKSKLVVPKKSRTGRTNGGPIDAESGRIVKEKRFVMAPMTPDEAVLQMDLLGHDFYFFSNSETGKTGVIGLIDEAG